MHKFLFLDFDGVLHPDGEPDFCRRELFEQYLLAMPEVRIVIARVKEKALGQDVLGSLKPGQMLVSIVNRELAATMGEGVSDINLAAQPPAVILMAGLQGAGKTTTTAKLAKHLITKRKKKVLTVSGDVYRDHP